MGGGGEEGRKEGGKEEGGVWGLVLISQRVV